MSNNKLIIGLGNPGRKYFDTRHNIGFKSLDFYVNKKNINFSKKISESLVAQITQDEKKIIFAKPQTFMNLSGNAVKFLIEKYSISLNNLLVISDDVNLPFGKLRFRPGGSHGGHNGLLSIFESLTTNEFPRLRIGIGSPPQGIEMKSYVLMNFSIDELEDFKKNIISKIIEAIDTFIDNDIFKAMNKLN